MQVQKKCAVCGCTQSYYSKYSVAKFAVPNGLEEKYLFELWHKPAQVCSTCGYASFDIANCKNLGILKDEQFVSVEKNGVVNKIEEFMPHSKLASYLKCGSYYNLIGDQLNEGISYLLASEEVNLAIIHYMREVSEDIIGGAPDQVEIKLTRYADMLFDYGVSRLELMYEEDGTNIDVNILLGAQLITGNFEQLLNAKQVLKHTLTLPQKPIQKRVTEFLLNKANNTNPDFE